MLSSERGLEAGCILEYDRWKVYELALTLPKMKWIWDEMCKYRTLFSDFTRGDPNVFYELIASPNTLWVEVKEGEATVGLVYWMGIENLIDVEVHILFFDRKPAEKAALCREIAKWFFQTWPGSHRLTVVVPEIYHATVRLALKVGFKREGKKRQSQLMGGKLVDEIIFGLLVEELK